jgi:hypothetical protein
VDVSCFQKTRFSFLLGQNRVAFDSLHWLLGVLTVHLWPIFKNQSMFKNGVLTALVVWCVLAVHYCVFKRSHRVRVIALLIIRIMLFVLV